MRHRRKLITLLRVARALLLLRRGRRMRAYVRSSHLEHQPSRFKLFEEYYNDEGSDDLRQFLRFSRADFDSLHETLRANLEKPRNRRYPISSKHRLAVFLRFIGHGPSFKAMETSFGISEAGIFRIALPPWMENTLERRHQTEEVPCSSITRTFSNYWMDMLMPELLNLCGN
ncbi:hypothetical protein QR680_013101 [Steinernema hermaphroditum]|uniref:DDE Tnp4 domain-containing protein n=1 Tax=Steinernema hermaphroditum TaxID=289476 RepID=A0AA39I766_9BILA|nr:hypothetical protein QR680_013101 [Steinernema hermaphroditum]